MTTEPAAPLAVKAPVTLTAATLEGVRLTVAELLKVRLLRVRTPTPL